MHLREQEFYKKRNGDKAGPMQFRTNNKAMPWFIRTKEGKIHSYTPTGSFHADGSESEHDLVAVWIEDKPPVPIDQVSLAHLRRGVERVMPSLSR